MKKELSPVAMLCMIVGVVAVVVVGIFFLIRNDPVAQGPHPPPRFDPAAREATEARNAAMGSAKSMGSANAPVAVPPGTHPTNTRPMGEDHYGGIKPQVQ